MTTALNKLPASAFELTISLPWSDVKKIYDQVFEELSSEIEIEGFRKGKAPKELIEKQVDKSKIYGEVINRIVPESYRKALEEHNLHPVISPQIKITQAEEEKDWQLIVSSAEKPEIKLGDYQKEISAINAAGKIWKPGDKPVAEEDPKQREEKEKQKISQIIEKLLAVAQVELPAIITDSETNRLLTTLLEDVRAAGLTYEQYLQSSSQTADSVKEKYRLQAESTLKLEFILEAVANDLKVEVNPEEIKAIIDKETDEAKKKALTEQSYILASILRRDKTIAKLLTL